MALWPDYSDAESRRRTKADSRVSTRAKTKAGRVTEAAARGTGGDPSDHRAHIEVEEK
jgi:hypothetical protein